MRDASEFEGYKFLGREHDWTKALNWPSILTGVAANEVRAIESLCGQVRRGVRAYLIRETKQDLVETQVEACLQTLIDHIQKGELKEISQLLPALHRIVKAEAGRLIDRTVEDTLRRSS